MQNQKVCFELIVINFNNLKDKQKVSSLKFLEKLREPEVTILNKIIQ